MAAVNQDYLPTLGADQGLQMELSRTGLKKSTTATCFIKFYGNIAAPACLHVISGRFHTSVAELSGCDGPCGR